ncbi:glycosyltransferase family 87 protein [Streptomyces sp. NPDC059897]|uniref:glycosyltransferase family 87 protein n=1 Tax=Streptomyces sp. NPDC059897 TaxID=3346994 RepID=UPI00365B9E6E
MSTWQGPQRGPGARALASLAALCAAVALFIALVPLHRDWFDLRVYYDAVHFWTGRSGGLYEYRVPGQDYGFTYPPFAALCMTPMNLLSWPLTVAVATTANLAAAVLVLRLLAGPVIRRHGWPPLPAYVVAGCLFALLEPVYDTVSFGQVNLFLLLLVLCDARQLARGGRFAGVGIGLAAAVKLTPALFIGYLLITRHRRAAATAGVVAAAATLLAHLLAPATSRDFWSAALWDTSRLGELAYVSNQSWQGALARLAHPAGPSALWWACGVLAVAGLWAYRLHRAGPADVRLGIAATGVAACLISPVTWVHHLVWALPALALLADRALELPLRRARLAWTAAAYALLCSSVVWLWRYDSGGIDGFLGGNAFVWVQLGLLCALVARPPSDHLAAHQHGQHQGTGQQRPPDREQAEAHDRGGRLDDR